MTHYKLESALLANYVYTYKNYLVFLFYCYIVHNRKSNNPKKYDLTSQNIRPQNFIPLLEELINVTSKLQN